MKEINRNQEGISLPPAWCGSICRNAMNQVCVEQCAPKRDCSGFDQKPNLELIDMPRFPETEGMTKEEKFTVVTVYLAKIVDHLKGEPNELPTFRRPHPNTPSSSRVSSAIPIQDLLSIAAEAVTLPEDRKERADLGIPAETMDQSAD